MAKTYLDNAIKSRVKQPLLSREVTKYRSHRVSEKENLETNLIKMDLNRVMSSLNQADASILVDLRYLVGDVRDLNEEVELNDGLKYEIDNVEVYIDNDSPSIEDLSIETIGVLMSKLSRIENKISRLEKES